MMRRSRRDDSPLPFASAHRPITWTGTMAAVVALGMALATPLFAFAYLGFEGGGWLNEGMAPLPLGLPAIAAGLLVVSVAPALALQRSCRAGAPLGVQASAAGIAVLGAAFLAVQGLSYAELDLRPAEWARDSVFVVAVALHHTIAAGGIGAAAIIILQVWDRPDERIAGAGASLALWWLFVVGSWLLIAAVLYLSPLIWRA